MSFLVFATLLGMYPLAGYAPALHLEPYNKSSFVTVTNERTIHASPEKVWGLLVSPAGFGTLSGCVPKATATRLDRVGSFLTATMQQDQGTILSTRVIPGIELRTIWDPEDGTYVCQQRVRVMTAPGGTKIHVTERYSDEQAATVDKTAEEAVTELSQRVRKFDDLVMGKK